MTKVKSVLTKASEAVETAAGYALVAVGIYAALFVDFTGDGPLWKNIGHLRASTQEGIESPNATRVLTVATQAPVEKVHEDRILAVFDAVDRRAPATVVYQAPEAVQRGPSSETLTDTPADPSAGHSWKRGLQGSLRTFTVYGKGDQTSSASQSAGAPVAQASSRQGTSAQGSSASQSYSAASRASSGSRASRSTMSAPDASRNIR